MPNGMHWNYLKDFIPMRSFNANLGIYAFIGVPGENSSRSKLRFRYSPLGFSCHILSHVLSLRESFNVQESRVIPKKIKLAGTKPSVTQCIRVSMQECFVSNKHLSGWLQASVSWCILVSSYKTSERQCFDFWRIGMIAIDNVVCKSTSHNFNSAECHFVVHIMTGGTELRLDCLFPSKRLEDNKHKFSAP